MDEKLEREKRFHRLLGELIELPAAERSERLAQHGSEDEGLRTRLEEALAIEEEEVDGLLQHPTSRARRAAAASLEGALDAPPEDPLLGDAMFSGTAFLSGPVPRIIGPYVLYEILGQGGMGRVFRAERYQPDRGIVALKLMRSSVKTPETRRRFDAERRTLERLEHRNIGRILDSGTTEDDYPYFAMELLASQPITEFCDDRRLPLRQRVALISQVCRGLEHAHGQRVLHRDVKPSNLLVIEDETGPVPKIIDFGIATVLDSGPDDTITVRGLTGTPSYMSPEALAGHADQLDERSDVYSVGAVLYELLVGEPPFDAGGGDLSGAVCRIVAGDVEAPSVKAQSLPRERLVQVAALRGLSADEFVQRLEGDLDDVLLRATAREADQRFPSALAFARALGRWLEAKATSEGVEDL